MLPVMVSYLGMLLLPVRLSAVYEPPIRTGVDAAVASAGLLLALLCLGGILLYRRRRDLCFWPSLYGLALLPVAQIVPIATLMNDRYLYFPMLGAAAFPVLALSPTAERLPRGWRRGVAAAVALLLVTFAFLAHQRVGVWENAVTLWSDAVAKVPGSKTACFALGAAYTQSGRLRDAADCFALGRAFERAGFPDRALPLYERALLFDPRHRDALYRLGRLHLAGGAYLKE
jgi:tetratricopeptide (TPR) repeat protein